MAATPTTIPSLSAAQIAARAAAMFPRGWALADALQSGLMNALFQSVAVGHAFDLTAIQYAAAATRIQTAANGALDLASQDYFGDALPRMPGETDAAFSARLIQGLEDDTIYLCGATRLSVQYAVAKATGGPVRIVEPWAPSDTGVWGGPNSYWNVDTAACPFRWTDGTTQDYKGFIQASPPIAQAIGTNPFFGWNAGVLFWGVPLGAWWNELAGGLSPIQKVYDAINKARPFGTTAWVQFRTQGGATYDSGLTYDSGATYDALVGPF